MQNDKSKFKDEFKKKVYRYILKLIKFIDNLPKDRTTQIISTQLLRSGTSIGANYFEARSSSSKKDFTNYFSIALKSANESMFWLAILRDVRKSDKGETNKLIQETSEIAKILASSILTLKGRK